MDLEFSDDEAELRDNVRTVLAGICPPTVVRGVHEGKGVPPAVWEKMVELWWPGLAIAEEHGGLGRTYVDVAIVAEELGRATAPGPFLATVTQFAPAVRELGGDAWLAQVAAGELTGTLAIAERGQWDLDGIRATATQSGDGWALAGTKDAVLDGATAEAIVVVARGETGLGAFVVPAAEVTPVPVSVLDPTMPMATLSLDGIVVPDERVLAAPGTPGVDIALARVLEEATIALATATVGACRVIFEQTLAYAKEREQYGRPIGSFQALKHRLADMYLAVERATALCYFAALTIAEDDPRRQEAASLAKAAAGECQRLLVQDGLQLHGGIGFTWEHDLQFLLKRAKAGDAMFGNTVVHRAKLATILGLAA